MHLDLVFTRGGNGNFEVENGSDLGSVMSNVPDATVYDGTMGFACEDICLSLIIGSAVCPMFN